VDDFVEDDAFVDGDDELSGILPGVAEGEGVIDAGESVELFELLLEVPGDFGGGVEGDAAGEFASAESESGVSADAWDTAIESGSPEEAFEFGLLGDSGGGAVWGFDSEELDIEGLEFCEGAESSAAEVSLLDEFSGSFDEGFGGELEFEGVLVDGEIVSGEEISVVESELDGGNGGFGVGGLSEDDAIDAGCGHGDGFTIDEEVDFFGSCGAHDTCEEIES
jgi:hypothetical protein